MRFLSLLLLFLFLRQDKVFAEAEDGARTRDVEDVKDKKLGELLCSNDKISTFCGLLEKFGLDEYLDNKKKDFTVFAPRNEAFESAPTWEELDDASLKSLLKYHIYAKGGVEESKICKEDKYKMNNGESIKTECKKDDIMLIGDANEDEYPMIVSPSDKQASNGYYHAISELLLYEPLPEESKVVGKEVCSDEDFSTLCKAIKKEGLYDYLNDKENEITLFAPTNEAFEDNKEEYEDLSMANLLKYHIINGKELKVKNLECGEKQTMYNEEKTKTECEKNKKKKTTYYQVGDGNKKKSRPMIIAPKDMETDNGYIHAIDNIILPEVTDPPTESPTDLPTQSPTESPTVAKEVCSDEDFKTLCKQIKKEGLYDYLDDKKNEITLFAPTDEAFKDYGDYKELPMTDLLKYHIINGKELKVKNLECGEKQTMYNKEKTKTECEKNKKKKTTYYQVGDGNKKKSRPMIVSPKDMKTYNGYIHAIDYLILPEVTDPPTESPTESPTEAPTESPTEAPTPGESEGESGSASISTSIDGSVSGTK